MAQYNGDKTRTIRSRLDPRNSQGYLLIGVLAVAAALLFFMGGTANDRTTPPQPPISNPQTVPK